MLAIVLKKTAIEIWENAVLVFLGNVGVFGLMFVALVAALGLGASWGVTPMLVGFVLAAAVVAYVLIVSADLLDMVCARAEFDREWLHARARQAGGPAILFSATVLGLGASLWMAASLAGRLSGIPLVISTLLFIWFVLFSVQTLLMLVPLIPQSEYRMIRALRLSGLLVLGNPGYVLVILIVVIVMTVLSVAVLPGPCGILILLNNAVKLRLKRYEPDPAAAESPQGHTDWNRLLADERERLANVRLRNLLFPWKW